MQFCLYGGHWEHKTGAHCSAGQECLLPPEAANFNNLQSGLLLEARDTDISGLGGIGNISYMFAGRGAGGLRGSLTSFSFCRNQGSS